MHQTRSGQSAHRWAAMKQEVYEALGSLNEGCCKLKAFHNARRLLVASRWFCQTLTAELNCIRTGVLLARTHANYAYVCKYFPLYCRLGLPVRCATLRRRATCGLLVVQQIIRP